MPMGPDPNPNTASAIGPATMARLEHGPLETRRRPLPDHIRRSKMLVAWKVPRKLAGILCTFKYTKPMGHSPNLPHSSSPPPAARGRGTLSP